jgi:hypothetical protein
MIHTSSEPSNRPGKAVESSERPAECFHCVIADAVGDGADGQIGVCEQILAISPGVVEMSEDGGLSCTEW